MDFDCPFVGRNHYFENLLERWEELRCIGIYGTRSVGKTRFVKELLKIISEKFTNSKHCSAWIDLRNLLSLRQIILVLSQKLEIPIDEEGEFFHTVLTRFTETGHPFIIILDNAEDVIDSELKAKFVELCKLFTNQNNKIKVIITSTCLLNDKFCPNDCYIDIELSPLTMMESKELLLKSAPSVDFGIYLDKIAELCEGLPLALLMTGSELEHDGGLLDPIDMVELLCKCRLKVLSQDLYPIQERIAPMYTQFLNRLSAVLKKKLGILSYIPGTFSVQQATKILDEDCDDETLKTLIPIVQRHVVQYDTPTQRFDIHGILRDCITEFQKIQNLPEVRTRYCKMFAEIMKDIANKTDNHQYTEALCMYNMEQQNFQKLMTDVIYTTEDTYPVYVDLATTGFDTMTRFVGVHSFGFIEQVLKLTRINKSELDEAFVSVTYGSVLTNLKGNFIEGEKNYKFAITVMSKYHIQNSLMKARAYQGLGWNIGSQGKSFEAIRCLNKALKIEKEMGMENEVLILQTLQSLAVFHTFAGLLEEGEMYHMMVLNKRRNLYGTDEHPSIGACFNNIGLLYRMKGDYSKALDYFHLGLDIKRKTKDTDKAIVISIKNVALTLSDLGQHDDGIKLLCEAFNILDKYLGFMTDVHDLTNDTIGQIYLKKCDFNNAIKYINRAIKGRTKSSPAHINILEGTIRLSQAYVGLKKYDEARVNIQNALKHKHEFIKDVPQNLFIYESYKTLMEISKHLQDRAGMECNFTHCKAEIYRLNTFFEDLGNQTKSNEMIENLKTVEQIYSEFMW